MILCAYSQAILLISLAIRRLRIRFPSGTQKVFLSRIARDHVLKIKSVSFKPVFLKISLLLCSTVFVRAPASSFHVFILATSSKTTFLSILFIVLLFFYLFFTMERCQQYIVISLESNHHQFTLIGKYFIPPFFYLEQTPSYLTPDFLHSLKFSLSHLRHHKLLTV